MFERFTNQARQVVVLAQEEARRLHHRYIGTEHLLLALLDDQVGGSAVALSEVGVSRQRVREEVVRLIGEVPEVLGDVDEAALRSIGIDLAAVRAKIEETFGPGALDDVDVPRGRGGLLRRRGRQAGRPPVRGHVPFTARSKKVLELSLREAVRLGHSEIRSEHILLGLLREGDGLAVKILADSGLDLADLRRRTLVAIGDRAA
jgi:ATP-dependent Clp protease ATP-binding subunit ClpA